MLQQQRKEKLAATLWPDYLVVSRRNVKWARIQVCADGMVRMVVPRHCSTQQIHQLFERRRDWIMRQREKYQRSVPQQLGVEPGQLMLFGRGYRYLQLSRGRDYLDREASLIHTRADLACPATREKWYRAFAKTYLHQRINQLSAAHGFHFNRLAIRAQRTRWGSCSSRANISLNWRLVKAPEAVSDYVRLHELVHTRILNHSPAFWREVARVAPHYQQAKAWLQAYGHGI